MQFKNIFEEKQKIRITDKLHHSGFKWITVQPDEIVDLPEERGRQLGFKRMKKPRATKGSNQGEEDPKKKAARVYKAKLEAINGIGEKTAEDIISGYPTEAELVKVLNSDSEVPIRDDLAKQLKEHFKAENVSD